MCVDYLFRTSSFFLVFFSIFSVVVAVLNSLIENLWVKWKRTVCDSCWFYMRSRKLILYVKRWQTFNRNPERKSKVCSFSLAAYFSFQTICERVSDERIFILAVVRINGISFFFSKWKIHCQRMDTRKWYPHKMNIITIEVNDDESIYAYA